MTPVNNPTRRTFLRAAGGAGLAVPYLVPSSALAQPGKPGANERLSIALIGCGSMGAVNLSACASQSDVVVTGACDVWDRRREAVVAQYKSAKPYADYRALLDRKDLDGVIIATPPHWHCLMAVDACRAGKDLYLQKPMSLKLGRSIHFDATREKIVGDEEAVRLALPEYRAPWKFPDEYLNG